MIYFKKCACSADDGRASHNKLLHQEAYKLLFNALAKKGILENKLEFIYNEHGKPKLKDNDDIHFNISHCKGLAVCVLAKNGIGVDVENIRKFPKRVLKRSFTDQEIRFIEENEFPNRAFFQLWTLKESYVKTIGIGISYPLKNAEFIIDNNHITANTEENYSFTQIIIDNEFVCSVCCNNIFNNQVYFMSYKEVISLDSLN